jgi:hypothetical protein
MSFTLMDLSSENFELSASIWSWKPTLEIIKSLDILSDGKLRQMEYAATGVKIELEDAHHIGRKIQAEVLPKLAPNKRMLLDLSVTDAPDDGTIYRDDDEKWKNYSASYEWLQEFSDFCLKSKGFQVF